MGIHSTSSHGTVHVLVLNLHRKVHIDSTTHTLHYTHCVTVLLCYCVTQAPTAVHLAVLVPVPVPVDKTYTIYTGPNGSAPVPGSGPLQARTP